MAEPEPGPSAPGGDDASRGAEPEARRYFRLPVLLRGEVSVPPDEGGESAAREPASLSFKVKIVDLSGGGALVEVPRKRDAEQLRRLEVELRLEDGSRLGVGAISGRVVRIDARKVGIEFRVSESDRSRLIAALFRLQSERLR